MKDTAEILRQGVDIDEAIAAAHRDVIERHRRLGLPLVIWRDGKVVEIPADKIPNLSQTDHHPSPEVSR